jgi:hypothetical protein
MGITNDLLSAHGFTKAHWVEGRASVADLFGKTRRCGIYLLHFRNGEYYIGKAVDVVRRYNQHSKRHDDIQQISFCRSGHRELNDHERKAIGSFERAGVTLRNISFMSAPTVESDFDMVMTPAQQLSWLANPKLSDFGGTRPVDPEQRRRYQRRYTEFRRMSAADEAIHLLRVYAQKCIPVLRSSEMSFWCCSCLPGGENRVPVYSRINVSWQEVLTVYENAGLCFSWHVALSPLEQAFGQGLETLQRKLPFVQVEKHYYESGGTDQIALSTRGVRDALRLLDNDAFVQAARTFNLRLMRKGACTFSRYHCMDLADQLMPAEPAPFIPTLLRRLGFGS